MASFNDNLYIWRVGNTLYTNIRPNYLKMKFNLDDAPVAQMTIQEFQDKGGQVRLINGELFYGMTDDEKKQQRIGELEKGISDDKKELDDTDYVTIKIAEGVATKEEYEAVLKEREELREEIRRLQKELDELRPVDPPKEDDSGTVEVGDIEPGDELGGEETVSNTKKGKK